MTDIQAALGLSQMTNLESWITKRGDIALRYFEALSPERLRRYFGEERHSAFHLYVHHVAPEQRKARFQQLREQGIGANVHYMPIYKQPWYQKWAQTPLLHAEQFYAGAITLPLFPGLMSEHIKYIIKIISG